MISSNANKEYLISIGLLVKGTLVSVKGYTSSSYSLYTTTKSLISSSRWSSKPVLACDGAQSPLTGKGRFWAALVFRPGWRPEAFKPLSGTSSSESSTTPLVTICGNVSTCTSKVAPVTRVIQKGILLLKKQGLHITHISIMFSDHILNHPIWF